MSWPGVPSTGMSASFRECDGGERGKKLFTQSSAPFARDLSFKSTFHESKWFQGPSAKGLANTVGHNTNQLQAHRDQQSGV
jgi:hypothetical protein